MIYFVCVIDLFVCKSLCRGEVYLYANMHKAKLKNQQKRMY